MQRVSGYGNFGWSSFGGVGQTLGEAFDLIRRMSVRFNVTTVGAAPSLALLQFPQQFLFSGAQLAGADGG